MKIQGATAPLSPATYAHTWNKIFSHKNGLKFSKKVDIFPEIGVSLKILYFLHKDLDAVFSCAEPWIHVQCAP